MRMPTQGVVAMIIRIAAALATRIARRHPIALLMLAAALFAASVGASAQTYTFIDLGMMGAELAAR